MADGKYQCPFTSNEKYNKELNGGNGFTIKEMIVDMHKKMDKFDGRIRGNSVKIAFVAGGLAVLGITVTLVKIL